MNTKLFSYVFIYLLEPGYYEHDFGIRLEDIVLVKDSPTDYKMPHRPFLQMETVTMCPIQTKMLVLDLLTDQEVRNQILKKSLNNYYCINTFQIHYLNEYHSKCLKVLTPLLEKMGDTRALSWLKKETSAIKR